MRSPAPTVQATYKPNNIQLNRTSSFGSFFYSCVQQFALAEYNVLYSSQMPNTDDLADMVGLPTQQDKERIRRVILRYENKHPGYILSAIEEARRQHAAEGMDTRKAKYGEVNSQAQGRVMFELPTELGEQITNVAPFIFRNKKHLHWFIKNFPELLIHPANKISRV